MSLPFGLFTLWTTTLEPGSWTSSACSPGCTAHTLVAPLLSLCRRFACLPVFSFDFLVVRLAQTVPLFSQIHSFVYRHPQEAIAPTLRSGESLESVCGRIALFDLGMVVSLVL